MKLFRKMRAASLEENNTSAYWKYAIGEVVFVVVGILLAFQIDMWGERRNAREHTHYLFGQVHDELALNIQNCNGQIGEYLFKDTMVNHILTGKADRQTYRDHWQYATILLGQAEVEVSDDAFLNLVNSEDGLSPSEREILVELKTLYGPTKKGLQNLNEMATKSAFDYHKKYREEFEWYAELVSTWSIPEGMIDYCLEDPSFINSVAYFQMVNLLNHYRNTLSFRRDAISLHERLAHEMGFEVDSMLLFPVAESLDALGIYTGFYNLEVVVEDGKLMGKKLRKSDGVMFDKVRMYPEKLDAFSFDGNFCRLVRDSSDAVSGLTISLGTSQFDFVKQTSEDSLVNPQHAAM